METTPSPLGHYADAVTAIVAALVIAAFVVVHAALALAPMFGAPEVAGNTAQLDTAATLVMGYLFGAMGRGRGASTVTPAIA